MFNERLLEARKRIGLTQKQIAEKADISISAYSQYENGKAIPPLDVAARICKLLSVSLDWLCGDSDSTSIKTLADVAIMIDSINDAISHGNKYKSHLQIGVPSVEDISKMKNCVSLVIESKELQDFFIRDRSLSSLSSEFEDENIKKDFADARNAWRKEKLSELGWFFFFFDTEGENDAEP